MYVFFRVAGVTDSLAFCKALVATPGWAWRPARAFGPEGEGFVRWCFAASATAGRRCGPARALSRALAGCRLPMKDVARSTRGGQTVLAR